MQEQLIDQAWPSNSKNLCWTHAVMKLHDWMYDARDKKKAQHQQVKNISSLSLGRLNDDVSGLTVDKQHQHQLLLRERVDTGQFCPECLASARGVFPASFLIHVAITMAVITDPAIWTHGVLILPVIWDVKMNSTVLVLTSYLMKVVIFI